MSGRCQATNSSWKGTDGMVNVHPLKQVGVQDATSVRPSHARLESYAQSLTFQTVHQAKWRHTLAEEC